MHVHYCPDCYTERLAVECRFAPNDPEGDNPCQEECPLHRRLHLSEREYEMLSGNG